MTVLVARDTPPAVRGMLKRWFVEPTPNVFVGTVNRRTREKVLLYLRRYAPGWTCTVIRDDPGSQGFKVECFGLPDRPPIERSGLQLFSEPSLLEE